MNTICNPWLVGMMLTAIVNAGCERGVQEAEPADMPDDYPGYRHLVISVVEANQRKSEALDGRDIPFFQDPAVATLYHHAPDVIELAWQLLVDDAVPLEIRKYQARMLQCLPLQRQIRLLDRANSALAGTEIHPEVVSTLLAPGPEWGIGLYLSYENPALRDAVRHIADNPKATPGIRERADSLLSGDQAAFVKEYNVPKEPLPRISCTQ